MKSHIAKTKIMLKHLLNNIIKSISFLYPNKRSAHQLEKIIENKTYLS